MRHTVCQSTAPRRECASALETEVNMMLPSEVASASSMMLSGAKPARPKANTSMGTMTMPPPTPSSPANSPATIPSRP